MRDAVLPVVNATFADDAVLLAAFLTELKTCWAGYETRYSDHPVS